jgi:hypothetical protein
MDMDKRPIVDKTTGISIGLAVILSGFVVGWAYKDATFKEQVSSGLTHMQTDIDEIKANQQQDKRDIQDLKVRVALIEAEMENGP